MEASATTTQGTGRRCAGAHAAPERHATSRAARFARTLDTPLVVVALGCLILAACGKKGDPEPPLRVIPNATTELAASQRGDQLVFRFPFPDTTVSGARLPGLAAVEVWSMTRPVSDPANLPVVEPREFAAAARRLVTLSGAELQSAVEGGRVVVRLPLPPPAPAPTPAPAPAPSDSPTPAPVDAHVYGVRTVAEGGEGVPSGWSNLVALVPRAAAPPPTGLAVEPQARGIEVSWQSPADGLAGFAVYRRQAASRTWGEPLAELPPEARSHLDASARYGERYIYSVSALAARQPRVESALAAEREVDYEDRFAPAPPADLTALPEEGGVRLVWEASPDGDAVGYHVYRQDPGAEHRRLTGQPLTELRYADSGLTSGLVFHYRVTAIDGVGNEGAPAEVEARPR
jgi:hypothetical protein